jgi:murein DD-endopeptidase MepM/ murein hydrolase activator NlpD
VKSSRRRIQAAVAVLVAVSLALLVTSPHLATMRWPSLSRSRLNPYELASPETRTGFEHVRLPFASGTEFTVSQGAFGPNTHDEPGLQYRWDFDVPYGTAVLAVQSGRVLSVFESGQPGGCDRSFNTSPNNVLIEHADGTVAQYTHVDARVRSGQDVSRGDVIAVTAKNGFICQAQLDFLVFRSRDSLFGSARAENVPVFFEGLPGGLARQGSAHVVP